MLVSKADRRRILMRLERHIPRCVEEESGGFQLPATRGKAYRPKAAKMRSIQKDPRCKLCATKLLSLPCSRVSARDVIILAVAVISSGTDPSPWVPEQSEHAFFTHSLVSFAMAFHVNSVNFHPHGHLEFRRSALRRLRWRLQREQQQLLRRHLPHGRRAEMSVGLWSLCPARRRTARLLPWEHCQQCPGLRGRRRSPVQFTW